MEIKNKIRFVGMALIFVSIVQAEQAESDTLILKSRDNKIVVLSPKQLSNFTPRADAANEAIAALLLEGKLIVDEQDPYTVAPEVQPPTASYATLELIAKGLNIISQTGHDPLKVNKAIANLLQQDALIKKQELSSQLIDFINTAMYLHAETLVMAGLFVVFKVIQAAYPDTTNDTLRGNIKKLTDKNNLPAIDPDAINLLLK